MIGNFWGKVSVRASLAAVTILMVLETAITPSASAATSVTLDGAASLGTASSSVSVGSSSDQLLLAGTAITTANGKRVKLPKDWSKMSSHDLNAIGVAPGQVSAAARSLGITEASIDQASGILLGVVGQIRGPSAGIRPASASGCNSKVCIDVEGSGLRVDNWGTRAVARGGQVIYPVWLTPYNTVFVTGKAVTVPYDAAPESAGIALGHNFANNTQLCNTWSGVAGKPCITVHS